MFWQKVRTNRTHRKRLHIRRPAKQEPAPTAKSTTYIFFDPEQNMNRLRKGEEKLQNNLGYLRRGRSRSQYRRLTCHLKWLPETELL